MLVSPVVIHHTYPLIHSPAELSTPTPNSSTRTSEPLPPCHRTVTGVTHTRQLTTVTAGEESGEVQRNRDRRQSDTAFKGRKSGDYGDCVGASGLREGSGVARK